MVPNESTATFSVFSVLALIKAVVSDFVNWYDESYLSLNVSKTKDLSIYFRRKGTQSEPTVIHSETVESVDHILELQLILNLNSARTVTSSSERANSHCIKSFNVDQTILAFFLQIFYSERPHLLSYMLVWQSK